MPEPGEIRFRGPKGGPKAGSTVRVTVSDPSGQMRWWQILEQAYVQLASTEEGRARYGDPDRGATVEQAWRVQFAVSGVSQVCVLASGRPPVPTADIPRTVLMTPAQLVDSLIRAFALPDRVAVQTFVFDGRMGHSITLLRYEPVTGSFVFLDPWPARSLLCRENNAAGVAAEPVEGQLWRMTAAELRTVIFAVFIWPTIWADLTGVPHRLTLAGLASSEFWSFFRVREVGRTQGPGDAEATELTLAPGGFQQEIALAVTIDAAERVRRASLALRRRWVTGPPHGVNPFALDITKSFLGAMIPEPDRGDVAPLLSGLALVRDQQAVRAMLQNGETPRAVMELMLTYLGVHPKSTTLMTFSNVDAENVERDGEPWLAMEIRLH